MEEFVLLLSGSIDRHSDSLNLTTSIGASIGISQNQLNQDTYKKYLKAADDALY
ncbi:hypothetical protein [Vibrio cyclitrophicus]|uniref:GGDEF domain-containing protein n=1 Tax=Vibrio cyclitrophicus ZF270 TaxID=1136176 RepID=A0AAN0LR43_9VIBR|nr:hypothetical protein [Vibrio cyclitrophicus]MBY7660135.1 hypothetical protein [Vibrio atlanticus]